MPNGMGTSLTYLMTKYGELGADFYNMAGKLNSAGYYIGAENWAGAKAQLQAASLFCYDAADDIYLVGSGIAQRTYELFDWVIDNWPESEVYELTATKICEAWAINQFEDRALTIAYIDRMRQLIWDEPFKIQWAARPEDSED